LEWAEERAQEHVPDEIGPACQKILPGVALANVTGSVPLLTAGSLDAIDSMKVALRLDGKRAM
jgi:hypothetical protein